MMMKLSEYMNKRIITISQGLLLVSLSAFPVYANAWSVGDGEDISKLLNTAGPNGSLIDRTSGLKTRTENTLIGVQNTLAEVQDIRDSFRASLDVISGQVSDAVRNGIEDVDQILDKNREGLGDFLGVILPEPFKQGITNFDFSPPTDRSAECLFGSPCYQFRDDLKDLLTRIRDASNAMISINGNDAVSMAINLDGFIDLLDWIPGRALFPLYRALESGGTDIIAGIPILLDQLVADFDTLSPIALAEILGSIESPTNESFPYLLYDSKGCQDIVDNYTTVVRAKEGLAATALVFKILGKVFIAGGKTVMKNPKLAAGFTEFLGLQLELDGNLQDSFGNTLDGLSDAISAKADSYEAMIDSCARLRAQLNILDNQQIILANMIDIQISLADAGNSEDAVVVADSGDNSSSGGAGMIQLAFLFALLIASVYRRYFYTIVTEAAPK